MTTDDRFARNLSAWLDEDGTHRVPDHLAEVLVHSAATHQRRWWSSPERWLPVDMTFRPRPFNIPSAGRLLAVAALIIALLLVALLAAGSRQPRLPAPFGPARNGDIVTSRDGDLYLLDKATKASRPLVVGDGFDFSPIFSRDGTKMVFLRSDGPLTEPAILTMYVANADGSDARAITPPTKSLDWFDWSPDSTRVAYMATGQLFVVDVTRGEPIRLVGTGLAHFPTWLPPDGDEIIYRLETRSPGIFAIPADGKGKRRELSTTPPNNEFDYQSISVSPDGATITFTRWSSNGRPRVFALDVATGQVTPFSTTTGASQGTAVFSPDGKLVAYARIDPAGTYQIVVADANGSGSERTIGPKRLAQVETGNVDASWAFAPDGTALLVRYGNDEQGTTNLLPLDGSTGTKLGSGGFEFVDVQRLAP
jgi:Tol biopolymer transport system component